MTKTIFENQLNLMGYLSKNGIEMPKIIKTVQGKDYSVASDYKKRYCSCYCERKSLIREISISPQSKEAV